MLVGDEKSDSVTVNENGSLGSATVAMAIVPRHRQSLFRLYALLLSLIILMMMIILGGIMIYRNFLQTQVVSTLAVISTMHVFEAGQRKVWKEYKSSPFSVNVVCGKSL